MRRNWFTTVGGIMAGFAAVPVAWGAAINAHVISTSWSMPGWMFFIFVFVGTMGPVVIGVGAKGADEHSTLDQVNQSQQQQNGTKKNHDLFK